MGSDVWSQILGAFGFIGIPAALLLGVCWEAYKAIQHRRERRQTNASTQK
jgi:hypothetical protein